MLLYYISTFTVHICNVSGINWMNDDRVWLGFAEEKNATQSDHNLVRPGAW